MSSDAIGVLPLRLIAPITEWKEFFARTMWHVKVEPDRSNGLMKVSSIDTLQLRGIDTSRFLKRLGVVSPATMSRTIAAIMTVIEYDSMNMAS